MLLRKYTSYGLHVVFLVYHADECWVTCRSTLPKTGPFANKSFLCMLFFFLSNVDGFYRHGVVMMRLKGKLIQVKEH